MPGNRRRDSFSEHTSAWCPGARSSRAASATRNFSSKLALWADKVSPPMKSSSSGSTRRTGGAPSTMAWLMPVSAVMKDGMRALQLISET